MNTRHFLDLTLILSSPIEVKSSCVELGRLNHMMTSEQLHVFNEKLLVEIHFDNFCSIGIFFI